MPSASPGHPFPGTPTDFAQILPGAPASSLQAAATFLFRRKRYVAYISGRQLNILASPFKLVQTLTFREDLVAVAAESHAGKVVVAGQSDVYVLEPLTEAWTKVWWERSLLLRREDAGDEARWLSWGHIGELLVAGGRQLTLFSTLPSSHMSSPERSVVDGDEDIEERKPLWSIPVASPVAYAAFSPTASLIATCGPYDKLVKIWRRLSFEEGLFDYTYLPHLGAVTHLEWRPPDKEEEEDADEARGSGISGRHDDDPEILYTIAHDGIMRVWRTGGPHDLDILVLHTTVDLVSAIPHSPALQVNGALHVSPPARYTFILPADEFSAAVTAATGRDEPDKISHSLEHLKEVISKAPDVVVTLDAQGRMSAWGLQSVGHKRRPETPGSKQPFHIAHAEDLPIKLSQSINARSIPWFADGKLQILVHSFDGHIAWWNGDVETFFSPAAVGSERLELAADWTGHHTPIQSLQSHLDREALFSRSEGGEVAIWHREPNGRLSRQIFSQNESSFDAVAGEQAKVEIPFDTGIQDPSRTAINDDIAALASANGKELVIVDLEEGYIEHRQIFQEQIRHLRCFDSTPSHNFLAVGFDDHAIILAQGRYERHGKPGTWTVVKHLSISGLGLSISALEWLRDGTLAIAAGVGIMLLDNKVSVDELNGELRSAIDLDFDAKIPLVDLPQEIKEPLPPWHPRVLSHLVRYGKFTTATALIRQLGQRLKFWSEGEELQPSLDLSPQEDNYERDHKLDEDLVEDLMGQLREKVLPCVSRSEQERLKHVLEALAFLSEHMSGLDKCALRYLFSWRLQLLYMADEASSKPNAGHQQQFDGNGIHNQQQKVLVPEMHWRDIAFAYHSTTQQPLLDILTQHYDNKISWLIARRLGITTWITNREALASVFESLAQIAYRSASPHDPVRATLFFLTLHKKQTLLGLWRIATWHKEQRITMKFLQRDFGLQEAKTAAKKNAYALMGKRRFEYAAAFFLLADDPTSACNLLAGQGEDIMLAIAVARLYSGGDNGKSSPVLQRLLEDRLLPGAEATGDRWCMSWCYSILNERHEAVQVLVKPLGRVKQRTWHQDDPSTLVLYELMRKNDGSIYEYAAVLRAAKVLRRMGLWLLALELVRNWKFHPSPTALSRARASTASQTAGMNGVSHATPSPSILDSFTNGAPAHEPQQQQPPPVSSILDGFASPVPAVESAGENEKTAREAKAAELLAQLKSKKAGLAAAVPEGQKKQPEPTQFKEPDPNSLLDSFGF